MNKTMRISDEKRQEIWDKYVKVERDVKDCLKGIVCNRIDLTPDMLIYHTKCTEDICNMLEDLNDMVTESALDRE